MRCFLVPVGFWVVAKTFLIFLVSEVGNAQNVEGKIALYE